MLRDLKLDGATNLHNHGRMGRLSEALSVLDRALVIEEQVASLRFNSNLRAPLQYLHVCANAHVASVVVLANISAQLGTSPILSRVADVSERHCFGKAVCRTY